MPSHIVQVCIDQGRPYTTVGLVGEADKLQEEPTLWLRVGEAGKAFEKFRERGVTEVVMAGKVHRPSLIDLRPDWRTLKFLARAGTTAFTDKSSIGDDRLLRAVISELEREGFQVVGVEDVLAGLHVSPGPIGRVRPADTDQTDISVGLQAAGDLGRADLGQSVVVCDGSVIAREGPQGTDALIESITMHPPESKPILVKTSKPGQDRRADLPVIGPETVSQCIASGFRGIVVEAGGTLVLDRLEVAGLADRAGLFVFATTVEQAEDLDRPS